LGRPSLRCYDHGVPPVSPSKPSYPLVVPRTPPGFLAGVKAFLGGFRMLVGTPRAWPFAAVPVLVAMGLFFALAVASSLLLSTQIEGWLGTEGWWVSLVTVLASLVAIVLSAFFALALAQPASGPALEALSRVTERELGIPEHTPTPFLTDIARSTGSALIGAVGGGITFTVLFLIGLIPGAVVVTVPLKFVAAAVFIGWDLCDYPLSVRGQPLGARVRFVLSHAPAVLGFSAGVALVALVPCGFLLVLPAGVCGATRLVAEIQAYERTQHAA
jgi:CysZ protein